MISDLRLSLDEWPNLLPMVISVLNSTPSQARGGVTPFEAFLGRHEPSPLDLVLDVNAGRLGEVHGAEPLVDRIRPALEKLRETLEGARARVQAHRSEEHTSELQSLMRISYAVLCL